MALPILDGNQTAATLSTVLTGGEHIPAHTVVSLGSQAITDVRSAVSGSVVSISNFPASQSTTFGAVTGSVSVLNFPSTQTIAGTVTANLSTTDYSEIENIRIGTDSIDAKLTSVAVGSLPAISGTVTVGALNVWDAGNDEYSAVRGFSVGSFGSAMQVIGGDEINLINGRPSLPVAGTVTVSTLPSGALTTRFGSVTTANTAQITSAVTNTSRKYLLAQNISAGTVTIGIGFSPTTTQGIQLPAGGGLTFDAFCPTGAVYWLGAVTGAAFTILEG